jgi:hypothetical protein
LYETRTKQNNTGVTDVRETRSALVIECWLRDPQRAGEGGHEDMGIPEGEEIYPDGRVITVVGNHILADRQNPFSEHLGGHGDFPFFMVQNYDNDETVWGQGDVEILEPLQKELDDITIMIQTWTRLSSMPWVILPRDTNVETSDLSNRPGVILQPADGISAQGIRFLTPPSIPRHIIEREQEIIRRMRQIVGVDEISVDIIRGRSQPATTVALVKEASEKRTRGKIDNKNRAWARWAKLAIGLYRQFMKKDIVKRLANGKNVTIKPEHLKKMDPEIYDIRIIPSGKTQVSRGIQFEIIKELDQLGVLGAPETLERRKLIAAASGLKGVQELLAEEEIKIKGLQEQDLKDAMDRERRAMAEVDAGLIPLEISEEEQLAQAAAAGIPVEGAPIQ